MTGPFRTHDEAFGFLLEFTDYEKVTKFKYDIATFNLKRVEELMAAVGRPHRAFRAAHVAGTKGKGSTSAMVQGVLTAAGLRTGLYTSPHLLRVEERMTVDGALMSETEFVELVNELYPYTARARAEWPNESPTYFELVTAAGFRHFVRRKVDFAVVEVGMGGRLDATNVIAPEVSVITRVDFDHEDRLGHTLDRIAGEKAGIIKSGAPVVCQPQAPEAQAVIERTARERGCPLIQVGRDYRVERLETGLDEDLTPYCRFDLATPDGTLEGLTLRLLGAHQALNAAAAVAAIEIIRRRCGFAIPPEAVRRGLDAVRIPARLEVIPGRPVVLLDGAHNPVSIRALCDTLDRVFAGRRPVLLMGLSRDKNAADIFKLILPKAAAVVFSRSDSPRAADPCDLAQLARETTGIEAVVEPDAVAALDRARTLAGPEGLVCVAGSFFLAGNLRPLLLGMAEPGRS